MITSLNRWGSKNDRIDKIKKMYEQDCMAKKRNLKREKAERNREYARQFQRTRTRNAYRRTPTNSPDEENPGSSGANSDDDS